MRVNYEPSNWRALANALQSQHNVKIPLFVLVRVNIDHVNNGNGERIDFLYRFFTRLGAEKMCVVGGVWNGDPVWRFWSDKKNHNRGRYARFYTQNVPKMLAPDSFREYKM